MNLTNKQQQIFDKIKSVDKDWGKEDFAKCWNSILDLNKFISINKGKLFLEFSDASSVGIKLTYNDQVFIEEKIYWNEKIALPQSAKDTQAKMIAKDIKSLAESIINS